jgi:hypothetical protein
MVHGDVAEYGGERADAQRVVIRDRDVVLLRRFASQADVAACLPRCAIAWRCECLDQFRPETSRGSFMPR